MANITTYDDSTSQRLIRMLREHERRPPEIGNRHGRDVSPNAREIRWGRTTTSYYYPTYPTSGNAVVIEAGDYGLSADAVVSTTNSLAFTAYSDADADKTIAICKTGVIPPSGTVVSIWRDKGQWWFNGLTWLKGKTNATISAGGSGTCGYYWSTSEIGTLTAYWDWIDGAGGLIASGKEVFLRWYDPGNQWQIVASEC